MLSHTDGDITGISTGFDEMDEMTAGLQRGELIIIAGRPSMGKTTLAMNIAENAAIGQRRFRRRSSAWKCRPSS